MRDAIAGPIDALIGHSWGGAVVILAGLQVPARTVIAIDPLIHQPPGDWEKEYIDDLRPLFAKTGAEREAEIIATYPGTHELDLAGKIHALRHMDLEPVERIGRENGVDEGRWDLRERIVNYPLPLYVALADPSETVVSPEDADFVRRHGGRNVTMRTWEGSTHSLHRSHFDEFARSVDAFLSG